MMQDVSFWSVGTFFLGFAGATLAWFYIKPRGRTQRFVDLISYGVTLIGLGTLFWSLYHYDQRSKEEAEMRQVVSLARNLVRADLVNFYEVCRPDVSVMSPRDCETLKAYIYPVSWKFSTIEFSTGGGGDFGDDSFGPGGFFERAQEYLRENFVKPLDPFERPYLFQLQPPNLSSLSSDGIRAIVKDLTQHIESFNQVVLDYRASRGGPDPLEGRYLQIAAPILAFAFGLGLVRRVGDVKTDWNKS